MARAAADPIEVAAENQRLRNSVKGAHGIVHVLVRRLAGLATDVVIPREEWQALPPDEQFTLSSDPKSGAVTLRVAKRE